MTQLFQAALPALAAAVVGYLAGSLNFGVIISRLRGDDVRRYGSGNAGSTNMLRVYGKSAAALTYLGDMAKGAFAVWIGRLIFAWAGAGPYGGYVGAYAALLGHIFPLYFGFKGGKGVATALGILFMSDPVTFLIVVLIFVPIVPISGYVSLAAVLGAFGYPLVTAVRQHAAGGVDLMEIGLICVISALLLWMHRSNVRRLLNGTENSIRDRLRFKFKGKE
jgi:glycerol-3-phosphate acyltransferase PlsY